MSVLRVACGLGAHSLPRQRLPLGCCWPPPRSLLLMSRRDQVFEALNSVQHHVYQYLDTRAGPPPASSGTSLSRRETTAALPLYGTDQGSGDPVPDEVLNAPPGQAQQAVDQLPTSRMARGDARDARRAAAVLRKEQMKTGELKKRHTFPSSNGRILLHVDSIPQKTLTYMGGTAERGRGAMKGKVVVHAQDGERISAIRLKIKAVVRVMVPRMGNGQAPVPLDQTDPLREASSEKEVLLLQLESKLYSTPTTALPAGSTSYDPTLLAPGTYEYPFSIDIPAKASSKSHALPPSFVLTPTSPPASKGLRGLANVAPDWASVKWYAKLTVERPGLFRANERIFAPFVYLPPPPSLNGIEEQLNRRSRLALEVDTLLRKLHATNLRANLEQLAEPVSTWNEIRLNHGIGRKGGPPVRANEGSGDDSPGLFSRLLFGDQVSGPVAPSKETFTLSMPKYVFPLRSGIPFVIHRQMEWKGQVAPDSLSKMPQVALLQRTNVYGRSKSQVAGTTVRLIATGRASSRPAATWQYDSKGHGKNQLNRQAESWLGMVDLPPNCTPCFDTAVLSLDYYLSIRVGQDVLHSEPVVLCCPPSRPVAVRPSAPSRRQSGATGSTSVVAPSSVAPSGPGRAPSGAVRKTTSAGRPADPVPVKRAPAPHPIHMTSDAGPSSSGTPGSSSRHRLTSQAVVPPAIEEKQHAHALPPRPVQRPPQPLPPAPTLAPAPPPRPTPTASRTPSEAGTHDDDSDVGDDPSQWAFHEDELTDLPPSYFEATVQDRGND